MEPIASVTVTAETLRKRVIITEQVLTPNPKPAHLGVTYAEQFQDASVVHACQYRPSFLPKVFTKLLELMEHSSNAVLDIGCGRGEIDRELVTKVQRVDAVDFSPAMSEAGKRLHNGEGNCHSYMGMPIGSYDEIAV